MPDKRLSPFCFAVKAEFAAANADAPGSRNFKGVAYGGGLITDHPYLGPMVIDIASTKFGTPSPALYDHDQPIGVISSAKLDKQISIEGKLFAGVNARAKEVSDMADAGMPWQMSVGVFPGSIDEVGNGKSVIVNGHRFQGPVTVFRNNRIRETSFCALGAATDTNAQVFSIGGDVIPPQSSGVEEMDQAEHDRIVADLNAKLSAANETATKNAAELATVTATLAAMQASAKEKATAERTDKVKGLFKTLALEFKEVDAKPYLEMTDEQFSAVSAQMSKRPALDASLTSHVAIDGVDSNVNLTDVNSIMLAAKKHVAEQLKLGVTLSLAEAAAYVGRQHEISQSAKPPPNAGAIAAAQV